MIGEDGVLGRGCPCACCSAAHRACPCVVAPCPCATSRRPAPPPRPPQLLGQPLAACGQAHCVRGHRLDGWGGLPGHAVHAGIQERRGARAAVAPQELLPDLLTPPPGWPLSLARLPCSSLPLPLPAPLTSDLPLTTDYPSHTAHATALGSCDTGTLLPPLHPRPPLSQPLHPPHLPQPQPQPSSSSSLIPPQLRRTQGAAPLAPPAAGQGGHEGGHEGERSRRRQRFASVAD